MTLDEILVYLLSATDCQLPRTIKNAAYKLIDNQTKPGAIAQYTCFNGYVPQSKKNVFQSVEVV